MGHGEEATNALCPMPQATGRLSLSTHEGMEFPVAFNESAVGAYICHLCKLKVKASA
ncbi:hypothetical protein [Nostoc sp. CHAB 5715]|uniref:hypothetical protein n=1 Tax=Nostoc sp. CHAB 5715 TaxID=2780400 RepID=UPI001E5D87EA|nr:hypothetical protein [Nostoc sp. CHAB 5715]MCC5625412.1 hypothetical protein [Nostoc sp. CHAB 5715]